MNDLSRLLFLYSILSYCLHCWRSFPRHCKEWLIIITTYLAQAVMIWVCCFLRSDKSILFSLMVQQLISHVPFLFAQVWPINKQNFRWSVHLFLNTIDWGSFLSHIVQVLRWTWYRPFTLRRALWCDSAMMFLSFFRWSRVWDVHDLIEALMDMINRVDW